MYTLTTQLFAMDKPSRREVLLALCRRALCVWETAFPAASRPSYLESVSGSRQIVDVALPRQALNEIADPDFIGAVRQRYREPLAALQDTDWELPDALALAYYAICNAHRRYRLGESVDEQLILEQALACLPEEERERALRTAMAQARSHPPAGRALQ